MDYIERSVVVQKVMETKWESGSDGAVAQNGDSTKWDRIHNKVAHKKDSKKPTILQQKPGKRWGGMARG